MMSSRGWLCKAISITQLLRCLLKARRYVSLRSKAWALLETMKDSTFSLSKNVSPIGGLLYELGSHQETEIKWVIELGEFQHAELWPNEVWWTTQATGLLGLSFPYHYSLFVFLLPLWSFFHGFLSFTSPLSYLSNLIHFLNLIVSMDE